MTIKMNWSTVKQNLYISNALYILQLVEQELVALPEHTSSSSILLWDLFCLILSFLWNVCISLFALLCFAFLSLFLCELYCLSFDLRLTFDLPNAYNFETCFVALYNGTFGLWDLFCGTYVSLVVCVILKRLVFLGCLVNFGPPCLPIVFYWI